MKQKEKSIAIKQVLCVLLIKIFSQNLIIMIYD